MQQLLPMYQGTPSHDQQNVLFLLKPIWQSPQNELQRVLLDKFGDKLSFSNFTQNKYFYRSLQKVLMITQLFSWNCGHQFLKEMNNITNNTISNI